ncbi:MAG: adenylate/guanylate cyclase domain-containing protein [Spirochaetes bacterium]|nr:adenylate/guanylate cyclase domain-containing protein [Spirochaetota bacterium]
MSKRIDWMNYKNRKILLFDYEGLTNIEYLDYIKQLEVEIEKYPDDQLMQIAVRNNLNFFLENLHENVDEALSKKILNNELTKALFRKAVEEYYQPKQLVNAIYNLGKIPRDSTENVIGVGFIDIADYSFISKFLSPKENQTVLNGLYNAFNWVLKKYGGYLNKLEGDSMMIQFGCTIDQLVEDDNRLSSIAKRLFYACVDMQKICTFFNEAQEEFKKLEVDELTKKSLDEAFSLISAMRNNADTANPMNALFQLRIRIGANIGEVAIGNYGPDDAKQWDIIGVPVIKAKRMEATAPIGGLRISEEFYNIIKECGVVDEYYQHIKAEATKQDGYFKDITLEELFSFSEVILKDKKNAKFRTYSVQVAADLPESLSAQISSLLDRGEYGAEKIISFIQYYRGNRLVCKAIETLFNDYNIRIRKDKVFEVILPKKYQDLLDEYEGDKKRALAYINHNYSLYALLKSLGDYQDLLKKEENNDDDYLEFTTYDEYMDTNTSQRLERHKNMEKLRVQRTYFYDIVFTLVFEHIKASILEFQMKKEAEEVELALLLEE